MATFTKKRNSKGQLKYKAEIRIKGAKYCSKTLDRLSDVKQWAQQHEEMLRRQAAGLKPTERHTVAEAIDRYRQEHLPNIKNQSLNSALRWWRDHIGERYLNTIISPEIYDAREIISKEPICKILPNGQKTKPQKNSDGSLKRRKPKTIQDYVDALSFVYNKAVNEWGWVEQNPCNKVRKLQFNNKRTRFLSGYRHLWPTEGQPRHWSELSAEEKEEAKAKFPRAYEMPRFIDALEAQADMEKFRNNHPYWTHFLFVIQFGCGLRRGEAEHLVWEENDLIDHPIVIVDMTNKSLILKSTKADQSPRIKPICEAAMEVFMMLYAERRYDTPLVFPNEEGTQPLSFEKRIRNAIADAGLQDFRWHDLRHTTASYLCMMGASLREVMEALHHKSIRSSERYQHLTENHMRGMMNEFANMLLVNKETPSPFGRSSELFKKASGF